MRLVSLQPSAGVGIKQCQVVALQLIKNITLLVFCETGMPLLYCTLQPA